MSSQRVKALKLLAVGTAAALLATAALVGSASAHGSVVDPPTRNYGCWERWGHDFQNPNMATEDPMCWQAWQANPNAMWNWNGLYREGLAGDHQGGIPDGQLCSGGQAEGGRYNAMDAIGAWQTKAISNDFRIKLFDGASHGADYIWVFVTRQGFDALNEPLAWSDLELVGQIGDTPASEWTQEPDGGVSIQVPASAAGRTGRHIVYTIWQASHLDQSYYLCSDVTFPGGPTPTASPTPTPTPTASPTASPTPTSSPTPPPPGGCTAAYREINSWQGGFQGEVIVTAGASGVSGWRVTWTYSAGQTVTQIWNGTLDSGAPNVAVSNASWNGSLAASATTSFGFLGTWNGNNPAPTLTCAAL